MNFPAEFIANVRLGAVRAELEHFGARIAVHYQKLVVPLIRVFFHDGEEASRAVVINGTALVQTHCSDMTCRTLSPNLHALSTCARAPRLVHDGDKERSPFSWRTMALFNFHIPCLRSPFTCTHGLWKVMSGYTSLAAPCALLQIYSSPPSTLYSSASYTRADLHALDHADTSFSALIHASGIGISQLEPHKSSIASPKPMNIMTNINDMKNETQMDATGEVHDLSQSVGSLEWDLCDIEEPSAEESVPDMRSSTDSKKTNATCSHSDDWDTDASSLDEFEDAFETVSHVDAPPKAIEDLQQIHAAHVIATHNHILPPYRIRGETADLLSTTFHPDSVEGKALRAKYEAAYAEALKEYERDPDPCIDHWELRNATADLRDYRHGLKVVHVRGETAEIPTIFYDVVCDETCPQFQDSMAQQVGRAVFRLKKDWWDDLDLGSLF